MSMVNNGMYIIDNDCRLCVTDSVLMFYDVYVSHFFQVESIQVRICRRYNLLSN